MQTWENMGAMFREALFSLPIDFPLIILSAAGGKLKTNQWMETLRTLVVFPAISKM